MTKGCFSPDLFVTTTEGDQVRIKQLSNYDSHKLLGCHKAPAGEQTQQLTVLKTKTTEFAKIVTCSTLNRRESLIFYRHIYIPSVIYCLPTTDFTEQQLDKLQAFPNRSLMTKCGYAGNTPFAILYGPTEYGGAEFRNLYDAQGIGQLQLFLKHWRTPTNTGDLLRISVAWWQLLAGVSWSLFENTTYNLPHFAAESKWIHSLRTFLGTMNITLDLDKTYIPPPQRTHDTYIMDTVLQSQKFTKAEIRYVNLCRLYLQVITVSDIATANGTRIDPSIRAGNPSLLSSKTSWLQCHQEKPCCKYVWAAWHKACSLFTNPNGTLRQPLTNWLLPADQLRRTWPAYYDSHTDTILRPDNHLFHIHHKTPGGYHINPTTTTQHLPPLAYPIDVNMSNHLWIRNYGDSPQITPQPSSLPTSFDDYLNQQDNWESSLFYGLTLLHPMPTIAHYLTTTETIIASDGSAPDDASFGWILSTNDGTRLATCYGPVYGFEPSSYRAEGYGMLSSTTFISRFSAYHNLTTIQQYTHYCDNQGLVTNINNAMQYDNYYPNDTLANDWDVLQTIKHTIQTGPTTPSIQHVKGHQDDHTPYAQLPLEAQLNIDADHLAEEFMQHHNHNCHLVPRLPSNHAQVILNGTTITHHLKRTITNHRRAKPIIQHLQTVNRWSDDTTATIDWKAHGRAVRSSSHDTTLLKHRFDLTPVGARVHCYDKKYSPTCTACTEPLETIEHLCRCPAHTRHLWRHKFITNLRKKTDSINTRPMLQTILIDGLASYLHDTPPPLPTQYPPQYTTLINQQNSLGWKQMMQGRPTLEWRRLQQQHLSNQTNNSNTTIQWMTTIIKTIWTNWFELWDARNKERHGHDTTTRQQALRTYDLQQWTGPATQQLFSTPLADLLQRPTHIILQWLALWKTDIKLAFDDAS